MRSRLFAGAANVAHLAGLSRRPAAGASAPRPGPAAADPAPAEDDGERERDRAAAPTAERDPEDPEADPEDDDEDREEDENMMQARARERARCQAILSSPHAARAVGFAAYLAFETDTPRRTALAMLERLPNGAGLDARMGGVTRPNLGSGGRPEQSDRHAVAASWDRAIAKARGSGRTQSAASWDRAFAAARH